MIYGTAVFRYRRDFGWMPIDWMPYQPAQLGGPQVLVIRDVNDRPALLRLTGLYYMAPRLGRFCKRPHRLAVLLPRMPSIQLLISQSSPIRLSPAHSPECAEQSQPEGAYP